MKSISRVLAASLITGAMLLPTAARANNNQMQQIMIMNNVSAQEQTIANQINSYMGSGQLTPQQGAAFNAELSQISSQAMMGNPAQAAMAMSELSNLSSQINGSLVLPAQYAQPYGGVPVYGAATNPAYGFYNNWRNQHLQAERQVQSAVNHEHQEMVNQANYDNLVHREHVDTAVKDARANEAQADRAHNEAVHNAAVHNEAVHPAATQAHDEHHH